MWKSHDTSCHRVGPPWGSADPLKPPKRLKGPQGASDPNPGSPAEALSPTSHADPFTIPGWSGRRARPTAWATSGTSEHSWRSPRWVGQVPDRSAFRVRKLVWEVSGGLSAPILALLVGTPTPTTKDDRNPIPNP